MRIFLVVCGVLALVAVAVPPLAAQPVINEFMASNLSTHPDNSDFDDYSDWIELHNPDDAEVSPAGHQGGSHLPATRVAVIFGTGTRMSR
jgi:hypothetical protein